MISDNYNRTSNNRERKMETTVISQIAQKVFYKNAKVPKELQKSSKSVSGSNDTVSLSKNAIENLSNSSEGVEFDKNREQKIDRIKSLIDGNNYQIDEGVIDKIAENIAKMFV
jgi:anti-sigma28 factor (negative regulator of flagellin synthesis)